MDTGGHEWVFIPHIFPTTRAAWGTRTPWLLSREWHGADPSVAVTVYRLLRLA